MNNKEENENLYMIDKKTEILMLVVFSLLIVSIMVTYYKMVVSRDFITIDDLEEITKL